MSTTSLARLLDQELDRLAPRYAAVHVEHARLAPYPTLASLVDRLTEPKKNQSDAAQRDRSELIATIIGAFQPTHDRLWGAILVAAFRPMLRTKRLYGADPDEREAIFFAALTEVVDKLDVRKQPDQVHAIVWLSAKRILVRKLRRQNVWSEEGFGEEADETPDPTTSLPQPLLAAWLLSRGRADRPDMDLVLRVHEWGDLKAYVDAEYAALPPRERARVYRRLLKRYQRAVPQLRKTLGGELAQPRSRGTVPPPESGTRLRVGLADAEETAVATEVPLRPRCAPGLADGKK